MFLAATMHAKSQIIYTDIDPDTTIFVPNVPYNVDSSNYLTLDINSDLVDDFRFTARNFYDNWGSSQFGIGLSFWKLSNGSVSGGCSVGGYREDIFLHDTIDKRLNWHTFNYILFTVSNVGFNCELPVGDAYFGLLFIDDLDTLYGWVRCSATNNSITIKDYAYNTIPQMPILAGQTYMGIDSLTLYNTINIFESNNTLNVNLSGITQPQGYIRIFNNSGVLTKSSLLNGTSNTISLTGITTGIYVVRVETQLGIINKQIYLQSN